MSDHLANIFVNKKLLKDLDEPKPTVEQVIRATGRDPANCDTFLLRSEGDETGERIELAAVLDRTTSLKPIFLRCVPSDRNVGDIPIPANLSRDCEALRSLGYQIDLIPNGSFVYARFRDFSLPQPKFSRPTTQLLVIVPLPYPEAKLDMFYTEPEVVLSSGAVPRSAETIEMHLGQNWRRFSWHTGRWNPAIDDLASHVAFIEQRLYEVD